MTDQRGSFKEGIQAAYPLLLAMGQGLSSGRGVNAHMGEGLAGMMALKEQNERKARKDGLAEAAAGFGLKPMEQALFDSMDFDRQQGFLSQMMQQRQSQAAASATAARKAQEAAQKEIEMNNWRGYLYGSQNDPLGSDTVQTSQGELDMGVARNRPPTPEELNHRYRTAIAQGADKSILDRFERYMETHPTTERKMERDAAGRLRYLDTGEYAFPDFQEPEKEMYRAATPEELAPFGLHAGQVGPDGKLHPINPPSGTIIESTPDGGFSFRQGAVEDKKPKLTVDAAKNTGFAIRMQASHDILNELEDQGTDFLQQNLEHVPLGLGNFFRSPDFQRYDQARRDFVNAALRRESGAVISDAEFENANQQYFPVPGDSPEVIAQKRQNRLNTIRGIEIGAGEGAQMIAPNPPDVQAMPYEELRTFIANGGLQGLPPEMLAIAQDRLEAKQ